MGATTSSEEDGTVTAAQELGSNSLGESAERKESTTKSGTTPTKLCSACGKKSNTLKKCNGCKCVWYCDKKCQNKHRKEHKKECKRIKGELDKRGGKLDLGEELDVGPLEKPPPREECPICMHVLPLHSSLHTYYTCCGKSLCGGCSHQHQMKSGERVVEGGRILLAGTCAFCRTKAPRSNKEKLAQLSKRVEQKDPTALVDMAFVHADGRLGLPVDQAKCIDLLRESAGLGCPSAQYNLGTFHHFGRMGLEQNEIEAFKCWEKAAEGGHLISRHNIGSIAGGKGYNIAALRHWRLSASRGYRSSMDSLIGCFEAGGLLHHQDLAETLQAMYRSRAEMKSEDRDEYIKYLKETGKYRAEYDF